MYATIFFAAQSTEATSWQQWLLLGFFTLAVAGSAGWLWWNARHVEQKRRLCWFQLIAPQSNLIEPSAPLELDVERLLQGLFGPSGERLPVHAVTLAHAASVSPVQPATGAAPMPSRQGKTVLKHRLFIAVPESLTGRLPIAAAGCGAQAVPVAAQLAAQCNAASGVDLTAGEEASVPSMLTIPAETGWFIGIDSFGHAVTVLPVPGSTIVVRGAADHADDLMRRIPWPAAMFTVLDGANGTEVANASDATAPVSTPDWADQWSPATVRCVTLPASNDPVRARWQSRDSDLLERIADVTLDCTPEGDRAVLTVGAKQLDVRLRPGGERGRHHASGVRSRNGGRYGQSGRPPLWSGSSRTARVSSARSASRSSSG